MAQTDRVVLLVVAPDEEADAPHRAALEKAGFRVVQASSGEQAAEICADAGQPIDLVICRVILGAMTGPELAQQLKAAGNPPVLLISRYSRDVIRSVRGFSFDLEILEEPCSSEELIRHARKALRRSRKT